LLILDEPTNHLDVDAREALVQALAEYSGAVLLISHDRHLIETSVDRLWLVAEGTVRPYDGDLEDYRRLVLDRSGMPQRGPRRGEEDGTISAQERRKQAAERRAGIAPLRRRIRELESRIERLQEDIRRYDAALADPKLFAQFPARGASIAKARAEAVKAVAQAEEAWIALSSELESATAD
jgi:ATP-binding cassette subfamily F protein 3